MFLSDNPAPLSTEITDVIQNSRMALVVVKGSLPTSRREGAMEETVYGFLLGNIDTIVYYKL